MPTPVNRPAKPTDEQILNAVQEWGNHGMTYVVANRLRPKFKVQTPWVLRQLKRLEQAGKVKRVSTSYAVQYCWAVVEPRP